MYVYVSVLARAMCNEQPAAAPARKFERTNRWHGSRGSIAVGQTRCGGGGGVGGRRGEGSGA